MEQLRESSESAGGVGMCGWVKDTLMVWPGFGQVEESFSVKGTWVKDVDQKVWGTHWEL